MSVTPVPPPIDTPDVIPPGKPPPPPPPGLTPEEGPPTVRPERPSAIPKRDGRTRAPFPSWPEDAPDLIRDATRGIRGGPALAMRGYVGLDFPQHAPRGGRR